MSDNPEEYYQWIREHSSRRIISEILRGRELVRERARGLNPNNWIAFGMAVAFKRPLLVPGLVRSLLHECREMKRE